MAISRQGRSCLRHDKFFFGGKSKNMKFLFFKFKSTKYLQGSFLLERGKVFFVEVKPCFLWAPGPQLIKVNASYSVTRDFRNNNFSSLPINGFVSHDVIWFIAFCKRSRIPTIIKTESRAVANKFANIRIYAL